MPKFTTHAKMGLGVNVAADQWSDDAVGPPMAAKRGSMHGPAPHASDCPVGFVPIAGSGGSTFVLVNVTAGPTSRLCNSEITGKRQSVWPAKPEPAFRLNKKSVYAFPSAAVPVFDHS